MDETDVPSAEFVALRARYEALMEIPIGVELIGMALWFERLNDIITDAKTAGINMMEVTHR